MKLHLFSCEIGRPVWQRSEYECNNLYDCDESQWLNPRQPAMACLKRKLTQKKRLVSVWWTSALVIYYSFLRSGGQLTVIADMYCQQLETMMEQLNIQQPRLVNCSSPLLFQANAGQHITRQTVAKLEELRLETHRRSPYFEDLAPTD